MDGKPVLAMGIAEDIDAILKLEGLENLETVDAEPSGMEKFAFWVSSFSAILILVGLGGGYLEMKTPGFTLKKSPSDLKSMGVRLL